jgi:hypothetical protein
MSAALAYQISDVEADASLVSGLTKICFDCDPDNPRAVKQKNCITCGGTGQQALAAAQIAEELSAARAETDMPSEGRQANEENDDDGSDDGSDSDLYLEY